MIGRGDGGKAYEYVKRLRGGRAVLSDAQTP